MEKSNDFVKVRNIFTGRTDEKRRNIWEFWRWDKDMKTKNNGWELLDGEQKDEMIDKFTQAIAMKTTEKKTANSAEIDNIKAEPLESNQKSGEAEAEAEHEKARLEKEALEDKLKMKQKKANQKSEINDLGKPIPQEKRKKK